MLFKLFILGLDLQCLLFILTLLTHSLVAAQGAPPKATPSVMSWPDEDGDEGSPAIWLWPDSASQGRSHKKQGGKQVGIAWESAAAGPSKWKSFTEKLFCHLRSCGHTGVETAAQPFPSSSTPYHIRYDVVGAAKVAPHLAPSVNIAHRHTSSLGVREIERHERESQPARESVCMHVCSYGATPAPQPVFQVVSL